MKNLSLITIINKMHLGMVLFVLFCAAVLIMSVRGLPGNPTQTELNNPEWKESGPFELSPERGRFALMYSVVENNAVNFSLPLARFTTPDVGYREGKYVSLFAPALSYIVIPGYLIGKYLGVSQVGAFSSVAFFAILNITLIYAISKRLGANSIASCIASFAFLFATPAYAYAVNLYQHHVSTFLILLSIYVLSKSRRFLSLSLVFFLCAFSLPLDYPNLFLMLPIGLYALGGFISFESIKNKLSVSFHVGRTFALLTMVIPLILFLTFNQLSYGSPFNFLGGSSLSTVKDIGADGKPLKSVTAETITTTENKKVQSNSGLTLFKTRNLINGLYIHTISPDRGVLWYAPILLFAIPGAVLLFRKKHPLLSVLLGVIGMNIILYSMWGDPWGGWAFGSRYLIPSYAVSSIFIAYALTALRKKYFLILLFFVVLCYSVGVNTLGAITSSRNPPQAEILNLEKLSGRVEKYTYERNMEFLNTSGTKSYFWNVVAKDYMRPVEYYWFLVSILVITSGALLTYETLRKGKN